MKKSGYISLLAKFILVIFVLGLIACKSKKTDENGLLISLTTMSPSDGVNIRYSPKGKKLKLKEVQNGMETELKLGDSNIKPIALRLEKSDGQKYFDKLTGDWNRNGDFSDDSVLTTIPSETRGKFWSSFNAKINIPVIDPKTGKEVINVYPISLWYVEDPIEPDIEKVIRFSRRGWMQGSFIENGQSAIILLAESEMDGIYDSLDSWALATIEKPQEIYSSSNSRNILNHAWLDSSAYKIISIHPSGREVIIAPYDPGLTRAEEDRANDYLAVDREAPRSGKSVNFYHDYDEAISLSKKQSKLLFIDFETTWCGPCKTMDSYVYNSDPVVDVFQNILAVKVDGDENRDLVKKYDVKAYPTMIIISPRGKVIGRKTGYQSIKKIVEFVKNTDTE